VERNRIQRDNVFFVICSMKSSHTQPQAAGNVALRRDWPASDVAASGVSDQLHNIVLLCEEDMQIWMTPSLFIPQGSTQGEEIKIIADDY
jgi:hypothetical protein